MTTRIEFEKVPRIDVFSLKGGVGKTTISWLLARAIAKDRGPVLILDADFTGTCFGDYVQHSAAPGWRSTPNLAHLVVMPPELLQEQLDAARLPVYRYSSEHDSTKSRLGDGNTGGDRLLFCPSHVFSEGPDERLFPNHSRLVRVETAILHALVGHESAGGWVGHVLCEVARATHQQIATGIAAWIVDHSPGFSALQREATRSCTHPVVVCSPDPLDLRMVRDFAVAETAGLRASKSAPTRYVLNRADAGRAETIGSSKMTTIPFVEAIRDDVLRGQAPQEQVDAIVTLVAELLPDAGSAVP